MMFLGTTGAGVTREMVLGISYLPGCGTYIPLAASASRSARRLAISGSLAT